MSILKTVWLKVSVTKNVFCEIENWVPRKWKAISLIRFAVPATTTCANLEQILQIFLQ